MHILGGILFIEQVWNGVFMLIEVLVRPTYREGSGQVQALGTRRSLFYLW